MINSLNQGSNFGQIGGAMPYTEAPPDSFTAPLIRAEGSLEALVVNLNELATRLCGPQQPSGTANAAVPKPQPVANGIVEEINYLGNRLNNRLMEAHDIIGRINSKLI